jgi:heme-degrading monooxygenase HmoA
MNKIKIAKRLAGAVPVILLGCWFNAAAQTTCKQQTAAELAKSVAASYSQRTLARLDAQKRVRGTVRIVIEHSLAEDDAPNRFVIRRFTSLTKFEGWLKSREHEELPARSVMPFKSCAKGVCTFDFDGGILHNNLYLKRITYGMRNACPFLKTIYLLDGD